MDWYYDDDGRVGGPCSTNELQGLIERGMLLPDVPVRARAAATWQPFDEVAELNEDTLGSSGTVDRVLAPRKPPARPKSVTAYLVCHWRGELGVAVSFWLNTVLVNLLLVWLFLWLVGLLDHATGHAARWLAGSLMLLIVLGYVILPWQIIGSWRSTQRHVREYGEEIIVRIIQIWLVIGVCTTVAHAARTWVIFERVSAIAMGH